MIFYLHKFVEQFPLFNLFKYISFRSALAIVFTFIVSIIFGQFTLAKLKKLRVLEDTEKSDSEELYQLHKGKKNTPTMGGIIIILSVSLSTLIFCDLTSPLVLIAFTSLILMGALGFIDDYIKLKSTRNGLSAKIKYLLQVIIGSLLCYLLLQNISLDYFVTNTQNFDTIIFPLMKNAVFSLGVWFFLWFIITFTATCNAVNLTDGLDGLATGSSLMVCMVYIIICYMAGRVDFAQYLYIPYVEGCGELSVFLSCMAGALLGFLWLNCYPAQIFMGDTGSLAIGSIIAICAIACKHEILLVVVGGVFVLETISVIIQVVWFKLFGKRFFRIAPIHHHFQFKGIHESKVTIRFWITSIMLALLALASLKIR